MPPRPTSDMADPHTLGGAVLAHAARRPTAPALLWRDATVTYAELAEAARTADLPDGGGDTGGVAVLRAEKSPRTIARILACLLAGRPALLLSTDLGEVTRELLTERVRTAPPPDGTALLLTTSGSTGVPKLVPLGGGAVDRFTEWAVTAFGIEPGTRVLNYAPLNFDLCLLDIWATLRAGGTAVLVDPDRAVTPRYLLDLLAATEPEVVQAVPMFFRLLAEAAPEGTEFESPRHVLLTGDHAPPRVRAALPRLFPKAAYHNVYGCTETNDSFLHTADATEVAGREVLPLGRPLPGVRTRIEDGELLVATPFQTSGYLHEDGPGERFADGWFRTGDLVSRGEDGALVLVGRTDFQVKVRGVRVNVEEVERVLLEHDGVAEAAVVALPDPEAGQRLHAVVHRHPGRLGGLELRKHCSERLTRAAVPSAFRITDEPLPLTSTGKVNRNRIKEDLRNPRKGNE